MPPGATMQHSRNWPAILAGIVGVTFTADRAIRADSARQLGDAPNRQELTTSGPTLRLGSVVGTIHANQVLATGLGLTVAGGHRFGRVAIESELTLMALQEPGPSSLDLGSRRHLGIIVRYDAVRIRSGIAGPYTMLAMFVEGGAAQTWNHWRKADADELPRPVPDETRRVEGQGGFGISIDHQVARPVGFPYRVAWQLGWRFAAPRPAQEEFACRGICRRSIGTPAATPIERSVLFQSSLTLTW